MLYLPDLYQRSIWSQSTLVEPIGARMTFMTPSFLHPEPLDSGYVKFRDGFGTWIIGKIQYPGLRWAPWSRGGEWLGLKLDAWDFIDFGVSGPRSPLRADYTFEPSPPHYIWQWADILGQRNMPDIWTAVEATYERYAGTRPKAVWNPYDGSWREIRIRPKVPAPSPDPVRGPRRPPPKPHSEFVKRAQQLYEDYQAGLITDEIYKQRLLELSREYT